MSLHPRHRFILRVLQQTFRPSVIQATNDNNSLVEEQDESHSKSMEILFQSESILSHVNFFFSSKHSCNEIFFTYLPPPHGHHPQHFTDLSEFMNQYKNKGSTIFDPCSRRQRKEQKSIIEGSKQHGYLILTYRHDLLWCTHTRVYFKKKARANIDSMISMDSTLLYGTFHLGQNSIFTAMKNIFLPVLCNAIIQNCPKHGIKHYLFDDISFQYANHHPYRHLEYFIQRGYQNVQQMEGIIKSLLIHPKNYNLEFLRGDSDSKYRMLLLSEALLKINIYRMETILIEMKTKNVTNDKPWVAKKITHDRLLFPFGLNPHNPYPLLQFEIDLWKIRTWQLQQFQHQNRMKSPNNRCFENMIQLVESLQKSSTSPPQILLLRGFSLHQKWDKLEKRLEQAMNFAMENRRYFMILEEPLKGLNTNSEYSIIVQESIPCLILALKNVFQSSAHLSSKNYVINVMTKLSNQLVLVCHKIIMNAINSETKQMSQRRKRDFSDNVQIYSNGTMSRALFQCIDIAKIFQEHYRKLKEDLLLFSSQKSAGGMKYRSFCECPQEQEVFHRVQRISERSKAILCLLSLEKHLNEIRKHPLYRTPVFFPKLSKDLQTFKRKHNDPLFTLECNQFEIDFEALILTYQTEALDTERSLSMSIDKSSSVKHAQDLFDEWTASQFVLPFNIKSCSSIHTSLSQLGKLNEIHPFVLSIFRRFRKEIYDIESKYERYKFEPPLPRNMPIASGCILWARNLLRRIQTPMQWFRKFNKDKIFSLEDLITKYDKLEWSLTEFEKRYIDEWSSTSVVSALAGLDASILYRFMDQEDNELEWESTIVVNLDPHLLQVIKDSKIFLFLGISIPDSARIVMFHKDKVKSTYRDTCDMLREWQNCKRIAELSPHDNVMRILLQGLYNDICIGMKSITWASAQTDGYIEQIKEHMLLSKQIAHGSKQRMSQIWEEIMKIIKLPVQTMFTKGKNMSNMEDFLKKNAEYIQEREQLYITLKTKALKSIADIGNLLLHSNTNLNHSFLQKPLLKTNLQAEIYHQQSKLTLLTNKAIAYNIQWLLEAMVTRICCPLDDHSDSSYPLIDLEVKLSPQTLCISPSFDTIRLTIIETFKTLVGALYKLIDHDADEEHVKMEEIRKKMNKTMIKSCLKLYSYMKKIKQVLRTFLSHTFQKFDILWRGSNDFLYSIMSQSQITMLFDNKLLYSKENLEVEINKLPVSIRIGPFRISLRNIKKQLLKECETFDLFLSDEKKEGNQNDKI